MVFKSLNLLKEFILSKFISNNSATLRQTEDLKSATLLKVVFFRDTFVLFWSFIVCFLSTHVLLNILDGHGYNLDYDDLT